jgi:hypothetical protein
MPLNEWGWWARSPQRDRQIVESGTRGTRGTRGAWPQPPRVQLQGQLLGKPAAFRWHLAWGLIKMAPVTLEEGYGVCHPLRRELLSIRAFDDLSEVGENLRTMAWLPSSRWTIGAQWCAQRNKHKWRKLGPEQPSPVSVYPPRP